MYNLDTARDKFQKQISICEWVCGSTHLKTSGHYVQVLKVLRATQRQKCKLPLRAKKDFKLKNKINPYRTDEPNLHVRKSRE